MSGPVAAEDVADERAASEEATLEITESRESEVGAFRVRRALPRRARRTVGAWCFVDHMGPAAITEAGGLGVAPHPHIGLQTVTWLFEGEGLHRDSLGSEQVIVPGQLNLMTAGHGVAHSEEGTGRYRGFLEGVQLWIAQPGSTRDGPPAFEHHPELPEVELEDATATVLVGDLDGTTSPARHDTDHVGIDLRQRPGETPVPLRADFEYALVVTTGTVVIDGRTVTPGHLAYLGAGRDECVLRTNDPARVLLIGGVPFEEPIVMWWNFVARDRNEILTAHRSWQQDDGRFGAVHSSLPRIEVSAPPWATR